MAKLILDDLSALIEPLLPPPKPRRVRYPGRKPLDNGAVLTGILFVLQTGLGGTYRLARWAAAAA
ncbi:transposase-like protein [Caballeronia turbans]|jgi:transposase|nr:transposase-like protein [Caballeronia turbans]